jgi:protocatechuate 3,4-dioxygenase beta subunit
MTMRRQFFLISAVAMLVGVCWHAGAQPRLQTVVQRVSDTSANADATPLKVSGTITDGPGNPVAGAAVEYWRYEGNGLRPSEPKLEKQTTTGTDGVFGIQVSRDVGFLLARKPGMAPGWRQVNQGFNHIRETGNHIVLTPPGTLAGFVADEGDRPVANAEVSVTMAMSDMSSENGARSFYYFTGKPARDCFSTHTDGVGHFRIENFPTNASAILAVRSPGKVLQPSQKTFSDLQTAGYRAGKADIKLVLEPGASIEGKIAGGDTGQPLPAARLTLQSDQGIFVGGAIEPARASADGAFRFDDVASGSYSIQTFFGTNALSDWVAETVPVLVEAGKAARGVQVKAERGALLEVSVLGKDDRKPVAWVSVYAYKEHFQSAAFSDTNGIVRLRLLPGDYQIEAFRQSLPSSRSTATVESGKTNRVEIELAAPRKISGVVHTPDGQVAAGVSVRIVDDFGVADADLKTDANGKFELEWNQRPVGGQSDSTPCVLVRDVDHNLAAAQDLDEDTGALDLKLAPGLTLVGRAECHGKPVTNATAQLVFWTGRSGMLLSGLARTNTPGQFEIPALPPGRKYGVIISAPGYVQKEMYNLEISADAIRQELDPVELKPANLKLAGQVLDAENKPVAGSNVNLNGDGQPNAQVTADRQGRFVFENVREGPVQLYSNNGNSYGNVPAEGGDTNVVLKLGTTYSSSPGAKAHELKGLVTDDAGQPAAGAMVAVSSNNGTRWVKTGAKGEFTLSWSLQEWQAQSGSALLVVRELARNLAATEKLPEDATNLNVKLKPALTLTGHVKNAADSPLTGAQVGLWLKAGWGYDQLNEQVHPVNAEGRYEIKCLPPDAQYMVFATAKGYGKSQQQVEPASETNRMELAPFVLKLADRVIAGQLLHDNDKPASGVGVELSGDGQPDGYMATDSKGRFHFRVCEGRIHLLASSQSGAGSAQATVEADDTNIVMSLGSSPGSIRQPPHRAMLKGSPLPDLTTMNLGADTAPAGQPVLLCLFDASQRPCRHVVHLLDEQVAALRQKNVSVLGIQAAVISDETFNEWKSTGGVSFPVGRVTESSGKSKWVSEVSSLPWLILADASHRVVAEGFSLDELDAQLRQLTK